MKEKIDWKYITAGLPLCIAVALIVYIVCYVLGEAVVKLFWGGGS